VDVFSAFFIFGWTFFLWPFFSVDLFPITLKSATFDILYKSLCITADKSPQRCIVRLTWPIFAQVNKTLHLKILQQQADRPKCGQQSRRRRSSVGRTCDARRPLMVHVYRAGMCKELTAVVMYTWRRLWMWPSAFSFNISRRLSPCDHILGLALSTTARWSTGC